jgi:hypothetical protein
VKGWCHTVKLLKLLASQPVVFVYLLSFFKVYLALIGYDIAPATWANIEELLNIICAGLVAVGIFAYNPFQKKEGK